MSTPNGDDGGIIGGAEDFKKADKLAARNARFNTKVTGNRYKEVEQQRALEREEFLASGGDQVAMKGTCEGMCPAFEIEFREHTAEIHPLEQVKGDRRRMDHAKAVAAYTRSDAGAGHGEAAKLPSDLRTPQALVRTVDYLYNDILPTTPPGRPDATPRVALGYTAGFIRDRTRAIRKEFAMQSTWGHEEAIASFERIARWHILCLRELQEETGGNSDMHIDSAELGRCFTSLRQQYNDRREELGVDMPCPNEPEFRAYMLIFDLTQRGTATACAEVPAVILDHPNVKLAWKMRRTAQRNFDSQKEGSKQNSEYGSNLITAYTRLLRTAQVPFLLSCLAEVRLRELRRSAVRALQQSYIRPKMDVVRRNESGEVISRQVVLLSTLARILGCEEQEEEGSAWDDVDPISKNPEVEAAEIARRFGLEIHSEDGQPVGVIMGRSVPFDDNKDAPYTRRWQLITSRQKTASYEDIINGRAGILSDPNAPVPAPQPRASVSMPKAKPSIQASSTFGAGPSTPAGMRSFGGMFGAGQTKPNPTQGGLGLSFRTPSVEPTPNGQAGPSRLPQTTSAFGVAPSGGTGGGFTGFGKSAFGGGTTSTATFGMPTATKVAAETNTDTTTPQAPPPTQPFTFKVPAIPETRKDTAGRDTKVTVPFSFSPKHKASEPTSEAASTNSIAAYSKPAAPPVDDSEAGPSAAKRSRESGSDIQNILSKPSFFGGPPKPAAPPATEAPVAEEAAKDVPLPTFGSSDKTVAAADTTATVESETPKDPAFTFGAEAPAFKTATAITVSAPPEIPALIKPKPDVEPPKSTPLRSSLTRSRISLQRDMSPPEVTLRAHQTDYAVAKLTETMVRDVISGLLDEISPVLAEVVRMRTDHRREKIRRQFRQAIVSQGKDHFFDLLLKDSIKEICETAVQDELQEREDAQVALQEIEEDKQRKEDERDRLSESVRRLGFGGQSIILTPRAPHIAHAQLPTGSDFGSPLIGGARSTISEMELARDFALHQAHQMTEDFYAPSSFLRTIGRNAQQLTTAIDTLGQTFNVVLSTTSDLCLPGHSRAQQWLVSKLSPTDDEDCLYVDDTKLVLQAVSRYDEIELSSVGAYVFEAPPIGASSDTDNDRIRADAQDRLTALIRHSQKHGSASPYPSVLLITTWTDETIEAVCQRLNVGDGIALFERHASVSLQEPRNLDQRVDDAISNLLAESTPKAQLTIGLDHLNADLMQQWLRLLSTIRTRMVQFPSDVELAATCFFRGIEALDFVRHAINRAIGSKRLEVNNTFDPVALPKLDETTLSKRDPTSFVESIEPYFASGFFDGLNDTHLGLASLRDAAHSGRALPISSLLSALGGLVFGEMVDQDLRFRHFDAPDDIRREAAKVQRQAIEAFRTCIDAGIKQVCSTTAEGERYTEQDETPARLDMSASNPPSTPRVRTEPSRSLKRHMSQDKLGGDSPASPKSSKKARSERLLRAIKAAQGTIEDMAEQEVADAEAELVFGGAGAAGVSIFAW